MGIDSSLCFVFANVGLKEIALCLFINFAFVHMNVIKSKFEVNDSLDYYHMTFIGKTTFNEEVFFSILLSMKKVKFFTKWLIIHLMHLFFIKTCGNSERR